ncbi:hypothetical protein P170DRAFT_478672 [Aspergillus steynii IBT 23096]|uniref:Uncharacterized protein n=1 Tax=Aspergillus steynii IBT 23096 TaxID=1392250 RepID=A0A2I2FYM8_9EURO|nr:uncharacterized protein P170DRAFT_478672 [Aspergillus steynii IBT 23096]PLB45734.1 hypothetical protein P170DRAFT_478672 [Aspergillus steynii IBT 23096]
MSLGPEASQIPVIVRRGLPRLNPRIPPIAKASGPGKLAAISHGKLQRESMSHSPDLRRCLGHHDVYRKSVKAAQENARQSIDAMSGEEEAVSGDTPTRNESKDENTMPHFRAQITNAVKAMVRRRYHTSTSETLQPKLPEAKLQEAKLQAIPVVAQGSPRVVTVTKRTRRNTPWFLPGRKTFSQSSQLIPPNAAG